MPRKLTLEERKFILKQYWKTENAQDVICDWNHYFNTDPPTRLAIYKLRDKFDDTSSVADAPRSCAPKFVIVWCHVVENVLKLKASNLNICHRNRLP